MKKTKKIVAILLSLVMVMGVLTIAPIYVSAYTAHTQSEAVSWARSQNGKSLDYDGEYGAQCVDLIMYYYQYLGVSSPGGDAIDYTWNALPSGWSRTSSPSAGDIVVWGAGASMGNGWYANNPYGHVGIVTSVSGSTMSFCNQNLNGQYVEECSGYPVANAATFIHPDFVADTSAPTISNARAENVNGSSFDINCDLNDDVGVTRVWLNIYGPSGQNGYEVAASNGAFSHRISTQNYGGAGLYTVHIYAFDAAGHQTSAAVSNINAINDTMAPTITNAKAINLSDSEFTITCQLNDNVGVTRVYVIVFSPDGTMNNGYDVAASNGTFSHTIQTSRYGGAGVYKVHMYVFDAAGNQAPCAINNIYAYTVKTAYYKNHKYELNNIRMTWQQAKSVCEQKGGHLAFINSSEENELITNLADGLKYYVWLGATDEQNEGHWYWTNGDMLSYSNWNSGEPNNSASDGGSENYLLLLVSGALKGGWNDAANSTDTVAGFVCEFDNYYLTGDSNLDGIINIRDVTAIQRYVAEYENLTDEQLAAADVDGNGVVNIDDATRLQMYLAEYDVTLG